MKNKKTIMIGILCTLVAIMAVGYALLAQELNINGRASIDSTWKVEITNITEKDIVGDATSKETLSYTATTANFSVGLIQPGDSITYDIEISNLGTLKAKVDSINVVMDENDAITYTTSGVKQGDKLGVGEKTILTVKVEYNSNVTIQPTNTEKDLTVTLNYVQDLGNDTLTYNSYSIGDQISFAGSNWYVIKNSSVEEDYVTLMKEKALTSEEVGEYATNNTRICLDYMVENNIDGCTTIGETITLPYGTMSYYWSDTCHERETYGYTDSDLSGCAGHNDYEGSKVRELLETKYIYTLGSQNLKEVDGYKIRLITKDELQNNLGYATELTLSWYDYNYENTPNWVYENYGEINTPEYQNNIYGYWTMTPYSVGSSETWSVGISRYLYHNTVDTDSRSVRPVINLLKSSI